MTDKITKSFQKVDFSGDPRFIKGGFPAGTERTWNGVKMVKQPNGEWKPADSNQKNEKTKYVSGPGGMPQIKLSPSDALAREEKLIHGNSKAKEMHKMGMTSIRQESSKDKNYLSGRMGDKRVYIRFSDEPTDDGINGGRIVKLFVENIKTKEFSTVYERGFSGAVASEYKDVVKQVVSGLKTKKDREPSDDNKLKI